jgi:citrate lyase alpha subunit
MPSRLSLLTAVLDSVVLMRFDTLLMSSLLDCLVDVSVIDYVSTGVSLWIFAVGMKNSLGPLMAKALKLKPSWPPSQAIVLLDVFGQWR